MTTLELIESIEEQNKNDTAMIMWLNSQINDLATLKSNGFITGVGYAKIVARWTSKRNTLNRIIGDRSLTIFTLKMGMIPGDGK
jgi:hypothetical protein